MLIYVPTYDKLHYITTLRKTPIDYRDKYAHFSICGFRDIVYIDKYDIIYGAYIQLNYEVAE